MAFIFGLSSLFNWQSEQLSAKRNEKGIKIKKQRQNAVFLLVLEVMQPSLFQQYR